MLEEEAGRDRVPDRFARVEGPQWVRPPEPVLDEISLGRGEKARERWSNVWRIGSFIRWADQIFHFWIQSFTRMIAGRANVMCSFK
jgi:hypothetical protein